MREGDWISLSGVPSAALDLEHGSRWQATPLCVCLQVGASQKIACVIDGESLMNDGSALVIFLVLQKIVEGQPVTIGGVSVTG